MEQEELRRNPGTGGESRSGEDEGRNVGSHEAGQAERGEAEDEGANYDGRASREGGSSESHSATVQSERPEHGGVCDGSRRSKTWRADAGSDLPASDGDGDHAESTAVDDGSSGRRSSEPSTQRSSATRRVDEESSGDQAKHDDIPGTNARGEVEGGGHHRDLTVEEMKELRRVAPWACEFSRGGKAEQVIRWSQIEDEYEPAGSRRVGQVWWSREGESQTWKFHTGVFPEEASMENVQLVMMIDEEAEIAEDDLDGVYAVLSRSSRKRFQKGLDKVIVSELYSQPRVAAKAEEMGLKAGSSFDLKTGYDFNKNVDRIRAWRRLKRERPDLLVLCPPCGPFSQLQSWNYKRMSKEKAMVILGEGVAHMEFAMKVFEWQVRRGGIALFEHPAGSKAWQEESVRRASKLEGVQRVVGDQCQFALRVRPEEELNKKATGFLTNSKWIAEELSKKCSGDHEHQPLVGGRAKGAEEYPPKLCEAIVQGLMKERSETFLVNLHPQEWVMAEEDEDENEAIPAGDLEDELDEAVEEAGQPAVRRAADRQGGDQEEEEEREAEEQATQKVIRGVSEADKRLIRKLHINLGHPSKEDFVRALRMSRAREEVWRYVQREFQCDLCKSQKKPELNRPAVIPRSYAPGRTVGVDVVYFPGVAPNETVPVLNIIDWASCYQVLEPMDGVSAEHVWWKFMKAWGRIFGIPELIVMDQGREFLGAFSSRVNEAGAVVKTIGARAPHQQGRTERHGGLAKNMFLRVREQINPDNREEWEAVVHAVEQAKNRLYNRSGFSPAQRQLGQNIRIPGSLGSDNPFESTLVRQGAGAEVQRLIQMREAAMEAFIRQTTVDAVRRAARSKTRSSKEFSQGEVVYVYRKPLARRSIRSPSDTKRAQWVGPGTVIVGEGANVWVAMRGEVWKCAKEQVRSATMEEEEAYGLLREEMEELREEIQRKSSKRGYKDISQLDFPEDRDGEEEEEEEVSPPRQRQRTEVEEPEGNRGEAESEPRTAGGSGPRSSSGEGSSSSSSSDSKEEPEGEKIVEHG